MKYEIDGILYDVAIEKKNNKNTYIRVKEDLTIYVTTSYLTSKKIVIKLLDDNKKSLIKMIDRVNKTKEKSTKFFYLGNEYDIITISTVDDIDIDYINHNILVKNQKMLDKWYKNEIVRIFKKYFEKAFNTFEESNTIPQLKIRTMKSRWGVYNRANHSVTLNSELIKYDESKLNYVIFHELSHIVHFNHSSDFWQLVSKYCPDYKRIRKELKE